MEKVIVGIYFTDNNYCAYAPVLLGCVSTANRLAEMKENIKDAIEFHVESSLENDDPIPDVFKGEYGLEFKTVGRSSVKCIQQYIYQSSVVAYSRNQ
ncbi:MAG TPA: type II toxin-antitoxin system HicB family antitoxin [Prolixibacteraceae bacterium]|jgi:predicted RNase H-like HicB family nuclease